MCTWKEIQNCIKREKGSGCTALDQIVHTESRINLGKGKNYTARIQENKCIHPSLSENILAKQLKYQESGKTNKKQA